VDRLTLIGVGIPAGSDLEYADGAARMKAMESRRDLE
jgi:recombinational DNA repair protein RecR